MTDRFGQKPRCLQLFFQSHTDRPKYKVIICGFVIEHANWQCFVDILFVLRNTETVFEILQMT